jgi:superfamily II DNA or RNA helicase
LEAFDRELRARGIDSIGYYVGGMKTKDRNDSATKSVILATFSLAAEGMNVPALNCVALVTPKSRIEQAVGRIFRQKKEERAFHPIIFDIADTPHDICMKQYWKRRQFYKQCQYRIKHIRKDGGYTDADVDDAQEEKEKETILHSGPLFR